MPERVQLKFVGSAGQGFGVFNVKEIDLRLEGEANDSVAKAMSGGRIVITPGAMAQGFEKERHAIIGNCALYGATGGTLFIDGKAGDRFAVRNSGARAVVEGVGFHACEYMSGGLVWVLGDTKGNVGAGMSGGSVYLHKRNVAHLNGDYVRAAPLDEADVALLRELGQDYLRETGGQVMARILAGDVLAREFVKLVPGS
jgi:glutamate synthase domain-containing protein 3